jgi:hypothetical protein
MTIYLACIIDMMLGLGAGDARVSRNQQPS